MKKILYFLFLVPFVSFSQLKVDPISGLDTALANRIRYAANGNVGIGIATPTVFLHVKKDANSYASTFRLENSLGNSSIDLIGKGSTWQIGAVRDDATATQGGLSFFNLAYGGNPSGVAMVIDSSNRVGIGALSPTVKFEVAGQAKINDGTAQAGYVFTATNSSGLGTWQAPVTTSATQVFVNTGTYTISGGPGTLTAYVNPSSTLSTLTFNLPATPFDGQNVTLVFGGQIATGATVVTELLIQPSGSQTIYQQSTPSTAVGGDAVTYKYLASTSTWFRIL